MMQSEFDQRLHESAPSVHVPADLSIHTANILADAQTRHSRYRVAWMGGALAVLLVAGGATAALAATGIAAWTPEVQVTSASAAHPQCQQGIRITANDGASPSSPAVVAARAILRSIDLKTVDTTAMRSYLIQQDASAVDSNGNPDPVTLTADDLKEQALLYTVNKTVHNDLAARGLNPEQVGLESEIADCGK